jgi:hypothetical protein
MTEPTAPEPSEPPAPASDQPAAPGEAAPIWSARQPSAVPVPPPGKRGTVGWIIGLVAVFALISLAVCCGVGVLFALNKFKASPKDVVQTYLEATRDQDANKLDGITCDALRSGHEGLDEFGSGATSENREFFKGLTWKVGNDREISKDKHQVDADVTLKAGDSPGLVKLTFLVVQEDGWKICGLAD